jgi:ATP-dependent Clp protease adaptor protein ClpS
MSAKRRTPSLPSPARTGEEGSDTLVVVEPKQKVKLSRPPLYKVLLHNDDFTPMEFVVSLLETVFQHTESEAMAIMLHAHTTGMAVAGVYTFEIAEAKADKVAGLAEEAGFPLLCTLEPESDESESNA